MARANSNPTTKPSAFLNAARLRDEADGDSAATAIVAQQRQPIDLVAADVWFQDSEFAGLAVVLMRGDSMEPTFRSGDFALIDTRETEVDVGVYAVLINNESVVIMSLDTLRSRPGRIKCTPHNAHYTPYEFTLGEEAKIVGRAVRKINRI